MIAVSVLLVLAILPVALPASLPSYIKACKMSDPNFNKCALEQGRNAIPILAQGDKKLKLRPLDPLKIPKIEIETPGNLKLQLTDVTIFGLGKVQLQDLDFDATNKRLSLDLRSDKIELVGTYNIDGKILFLPIAGNGNININMSQPFINYAFSYTLIEKEGKAFMQPDKPDVTLKSERNFYFLDNLFNGDKKLGEEMNKFLNDNDKELAKELTPSVEQTIAAIASDIVKKVIVNVPFDEVVVP